MPVRIGDRPRNRHHPAREQVREVGADVRHRQQQGLRALPEFEEFHGPILARGEQPRGFCRVVAACNETLQAVDAERKAQQIARAQQRIQRLNSAKNNKHLLSQHASKKMPTTVQVNG